MSNITVTVQRSSKNVGYSSKVKSDETELHVQLLKVSCHYMQMMWSFSYRTQKCLGSYLIGYWGSMEEFLDTKLMKENQ